MIEYIEHSEIDKSKWDECIRNSFNGIIYAYSWYLDLACPGWDALIEGEYESVFPLTKGKKYGIEYLYPPYFTQQLGLFSKNKISGNQLSLFLSAIPDKFKFIEINLNSENNFSTEGFIQKKNLTHHLNLNIAHENIYKNYSENLQRNLKKAAKFNQDIIHDASTGKIIKLFRENRGKEIKKLNDEHYKTFIKIIEAAKQRNSVKTYGIENETNEVIAGAFFMESNGKAIFIFSGSNAEAKEKFSMPLLIDAFIKEHSGKNMLLDFEGSNDLNLARFYKSFGAEEVVYLQIKKNNLPFPLKLLKR
ncbi:MAG: hypothetical protein ACHQNT_11040 [Bacteroidia bacterium]